VCAPFLAVHTTCHPILITIGHPWLRHNSLAPTRSSHPQGAHSSIANRTMAQTMRALSNTTDMKTAAVRAPQRPAVLARSARVGRQQSKQMQMSTISSCPSVPRPQQVQRSSPIVSVAAQEAPTAQATSTKVRLRKFRSHSSSSSSTGQAAVPCGVHMGRPNPATAGLGSGLKPDCISQCSLVMHPALLWFRKEQSLGPFCTCPYPDSLASAVQLGSTVLTTHRT
jgi:hypothetical protein